MNIMNRERITQQIPEIKRVLSISELNSAYDCGLVSLYQKVFSEPPYYEYFSNNEVRQYWDEYFSKGIVLYCQQPDRNVIGFAAAIPLSFEPEVAELSKAFGFIPEIDWYHAEVGVSPQFRVKNIGTNLVKKLIERIPTDKILMRTQENNIGSLKLHTKIGFEIIPGIVQDKLNNRTYGSKTTDRRIFLVYRKK